jgi:hypothetical protein
MLKLEGLFKSHSPENKGRVRGIYVQDVGILRWPRRVIVTANSSSSSCSFKLSAVPSIEALTAGYSCRKVTAFTESSRHTHAHDWTPKPLNDALKRSTLKCQRKVTVRPEAEKRQHTSCPQAGSA